MHGPQLSVASEREPGPGWAHAAGLTEGQTKADFSDQGLGPMDCKIMKAEFEFSGFIAAVTWVSVLSNPIGDGADALI